MSPASTSTLSQVFSRARLHARLFDGVQPTTLVVESQWPNECFVDGIGINILVSADPGFPNGGAAYHDTAVWLQGNA